MKRWQGPSSDMDDLAVLTPSFRGDASLFADLHDSVLANTAPSVVHHVVVPPSGDVPPVSTVRGDPVPSLDTQDLLPRYCLEVAIHRSPGRSGGGGPA